MAIPLGGRIGWVTLFKRTLKETIADNCFGLAAQLAYYYFLSVFPALLVIVALTTVFPRNLLDQILAWTGSFTPPDVLQIVRAQIQLITTSGHTGLLTFGALGALWSSSSAMNATIDTLNRAYGIREARAWWKVQSLAIVLTVVMSLFVLVAFTLVVAGPEIAEKVATRHGLGPLFEWAWKIVQWPVIFLLISEGFAFVYYLAPDAEQRWRGFCPAPISRRPCGC
jgi:membrane protein